MDTLERRGEPPGTAREVVVLGTSSQVPTPTRNHNGYLVRLDSELILFDPGEGTQRQLTIAGYSPARITRICITHFHGDHCLGLPGVLQRRWLDQPHRPLDLYFPAEGAPYVDRLRRASFVAHEDEGELTEHAVDGDGPVADLGRFALHAHRLVHRAPTVGWRLQEHPRRHLLPERLEALGIEGGDVGRLQRQGSLDLDGSAVELDEVSEIRPGLGLAFVMDTSLCDGAFELADGADVLICESTFASSEADLAHQYGHLTAREAARLAAESGVRLLVLGHLSPRYPDARLLADEANEVFPGAIVAHDLQRIPIPHLDRRTTPEVPG